MECPPYGGAAKQRQDHPPRLHQRNTQTPLHPPGRPLAGSARSRFRTGIFCDSLLPLQCPVSAASRRGQCARWLSAIRYFPDPPGNVTEQIGERKQLHCARIDSGGTPPRPVSFYGAIPGFYRLSIDSVGNKHSKNPQTQTGAETETHHPSQSEGSISRWLGGILKTNY